MTFPCGLPLGQILGLCWISSMVRPGLRARSFSQTPLRFTPAIGLARMPWSIVRIWRGDWAVTHRNRLGHGRESGPASDSDDLFRGSAFPFPPLHGVVVHLDVDGGLDSLVLGLGRKVFVSGPQHWGPGLARSSSSLGRWGNDELEHDGGNRERRVRMG